MTPPEGGSQSDWSTNTDLRDVRDQILGEMRTGFDRTHARLDLLNGRVAKNEADIVRNSERIKTLFARLFERRHHERRDDEETEKRPITKRDVMLVIAGGAGLLAFIKFLVWIAPALNALTP